jgi:NAD(P)-dependent dehydrogenase (short-subunit alcohol dehydrogenase family)
MKKVTEKTLKDKVIVCTGAAGVLCSSMTEDLLRHGAKVAVLDLRKEVADAFVAALKKKGLKNCIAVEANVLDEKSLVAARKEIISKFKKIDVLINGAGGNHPKGTTQVEQMTKGVKLEDTFFGLTAEGFEFVNRLNLIGTILPCQVFCKEMLKKGGCVLNICSMAAYQPLTKVAAYGAAKAGIMNFTKFLATHLAPMGVRVNAIAPGFFITEQNRFLMLEKDGKTLTPRGNKVIAKTPMRKFGTPEDLHGATRFLISDDASFITGVTLPVDGGFVSYSGV